MVKKTISLETRLTEVKQIHSKVIDLTTKQGIRESTQLDNLYLQRYELERAIEKDLTNGERLKNPIEDYCFRALSGSKKNNGMTGKCSYITVFDYIPKVEEFFKQVVKLKGEKILTVYGDHPKETGIISGDCKVEIKQDNPFNHRKLYVPVKKLLRFNKNKKWEEDNEKPEVCIDIDIFTYPSILTGNNFSVFEKEISIIYETDHSKEIYFGGPGPEETKIYLGDEGTKIRLKNNIIITIPAKNIKIPQPKY